MDLLTVSIILSEIGFSAPLPASIKISFKPNNSPAIAVHAEIAGLFEGIGVVLLIMIQ